MLQPSTPCVQGAAAQSAEAGRPSGFAGPCSAATQRLQIRPSCCCCRSPPRRAGGRHVLAGHVRGRVYKTAHLSFGDIVVVILVLVAWAPRGAPQHARGGGDRYKQARQKEGKNARATHPVVLEPERAVWWHPPGCGAAGVTVGAVAPAPPRCNALAGPTSNPAHPFKARRPARGPGGGGQARREGVEMRRLSTQRA